MRGLSGVVSWAPRHCGLDCMDEGGDLLEGFKTKVITKDNAKTFKDLNLTHPSLKDEQFYDTIKGPSFYAD